MESGGSGALRKVMTALAVIGVAVATYLTYIHYAGINPVCTAGTSCLRVQSSVWSKLAGVPVALMGLIGYVGILASLVVPDREQTRQATLVLTLIGFGFSGYLTYRELYSIHAICEWCVSSAVILTLLTIGASIRYVLGDGPRPTSAAPPTPASPAVPQPTSNTLGAGGQ